MPTSFVVHEPIRGSVSTTERGALQFEFDAGTVVPESDDERLVLEHLALSGAVEKVEDEPQDAASVWADRVAPRCPTCGHKLSVTPGTETPPAAPSAAPALEKALAAVEQARDAVKEASAATDELHQAALQAAADAAPAEPAPAAEPEKAAEPEPETEKPAEPAAPAEAPAAPEKPEAVAPTEPPAPVTDVEPAAAAAAPANQ